MTSHGGRSLNGRVVLGVILKVERRENHNFEGPHLGLPLISLVGGLKRLLRQVKGKNPRNGVPGPWLWEMGLQGHFL